MAAFLALAIHPFVASAELGDTVTDLIIGQPNAVTYAPNSTGVNADGLFFPYGLAFDVAGNLFVADSENSRVLIYVSPLRTDRTADVVLGQPDFNSRVGNHGEDYPSATTLWQPSGVAVDKHGNVWVADSSNNRVLEYDNPLTTDVVADHVFGQPDFTSRIANNGGISANTLYVPSAVLMDDEDNLWVSDAGNLRVLAFDTPLATGDREADLVVCQDSFDTDAPGTSATRVESLAGIALDSKHNLWVTDPLNSRVLEFDDPKHHDGIADHVLGQPGFMSNHDNYTGSIDALGAYNASGVLVDPNGNVYVADVGNNRVLFYQSPVELADRAADYAFGQPNLTSGTYNNGGISAQTLSNPASTAMSKMGDLAISDSSNHRIILVQTPVPIITSISVKVSRSGRGKLVIKGLGMFAGRATVTVDGTPLSTVKYKMAGSDGTAGVITATDPNFDSIVQPGRTVEVTIANQNSPLHSAPIRFTR